MARQAPGEGSSSPSGKLRILAVDRSGTSGERLKITLSNGSSFFLPIELLLQLDQSGEALQPGNELDDDTAQRLKEQAQAFSVRQKALHLLEASPHTAAALRRKLLSKGYEPGLVAAELRRLAGQGLIDDRLFAREWVQQRMERHPEGEAVLIAGLVQRGVRKELAEEVTRSLFTLEAERESALRLARKLKRRSDFTAERLSATLFARGFRHGLIREILSEENELGL